MLKPDEKEISLARDGKKILETKDAEIEIVLHREKEMKIALPKSAVRVLIEALTYISEGREVVVKPLNEELTTQKAAEFLRVSRPFLIKLLESGEIPFRKVGKHRRVSLSDLENYKQRIDEKRIKVLAELAEQAQNLGMGY
jgi:excisionase family DNA binding protein